jgi:hypothetical protein
MAVAPYLSQFEFATCTGARDLEVKQAPFPTSDRPTEPAIVIDHIGEDELKAMCPGNARVEVADSKTMVICRSHSQRKALFEQLERYEPSFIEVEQEKAPPATRKANVIVIEPIPDDPDLEEFSHRIKELGKFLIEIEELANGKEKMTLRSRRRKPIKVLAKFMKDFTINEVPVPFKAKAITV